MRTGKGFPVSADDNDTSNTPSNEPTHQMPHDVVALNGQSSNVPLKNGGRANARIVTVKSEPYPFSEIEDVNWIEVVDAAQSGLEVSFEYDEGRKSLYILLGDNKQVGDLKRRPRITKREVRTNWKWAKRVIFGSWDRDLERWIEEDDRREARQQLAGRPGQMGRPGQNEEYELGLDFEAGRKTDYLNVWRERAHKWSRILEFVFLGLPIAIANIEGLPLYVVLPVSAALFVGAWAMDAVKSKNRRWKARLS